MFRRTVQWIFVTCLLVTPSLAQFGVAGGRRKAGTTFEDLNEMAQQQQGGGAAATDDMAKMQEMIANAFNNPEMMEAMEKMGDQMGKAMEEMAKMDPEQLQKQMQDAMAMLTTGDMVNNIVDKKDEVLKNLEGSGMVSAEELAKYKTDPEYFEEQMRTAFDQMAGIFNDPDVLGSVTGAMQAMGDPAMLEFNNLLREGMTDDVKLEEARLQLLSNPKLSDNKLLSAIFEQEEFQEIVKDAEKWKGAFREGQDMMKKQFGAGLGGLKAGAGMGEL